MSVCSYSYFIFLIHLETHDCFPKWREQGLFLVKSGQTASVSYCSLLHCCQSGKGGHIRVWFQCLSLGQMLELDCPWRDWVQAGFEGGRGEGGAKKSSFWTCAGSASHWVVGTAAFLMNCFAITPSTFWNYLTAGYRVSLTYRHYWFFGLKLQVIPNLFILCRSVGFQHPLANW